MNGWLKKTRDGKPFLSLAFKPKQETPDKSKSRASRAEDLNDQIPF